MKVLPKCQQSTCYKASTTEFHSGGHHYWEGFTSLHSDVARWTLMSHQALRSSALVVISDASTQSPLRRVKQLGHVRGCRVCPPLAPSVLGSQFHTEELRRAWQARSRALQIFLDELSFSGNQGQPSSQNPARHASHGQSGVALIASAKCRS